MTVTGSGATIDGVNDGQGLRPVIRTGDFKVINTRPPRYGGRGLLNGYHVRENIFVNILVHHHRLVPRIHLRSTNIGEGQ